jgi:hypothetical protein
LLGCSLLILWKMKKKWTIRPQCWESLLPDVNISLRQDLNDLFPFGKNLKWCYRPKGEPLLKASFDLTPSLYRLASQLPFERPLFANLHLIMGSATAWPHPIRGLLYITNRLQIVQPTNLETWRKNIWNTPKYGTRVAKLSPITFWGDTWQ